MMTLLAGSRNQPSFEVRFQHAGAPKEHSSIISDHTFAPGLSSRGCRMRFCRSRSRGYFNLAVLASLAAVVMIIRMCIKGKGRELSRARRLSDSSDSGPADPTTCEAWLDEDASAESSAGEPDLAQGKASTTTTLQTTRKRVYSQRETTQGMLPVGETSWLQSFSPPHHSSKKARTELIGPRSEDRIAAELLAQQMLNEPPAPSKSSEILTPASGLYISDRELQSALQYLEGVKFLEEAPLQHVVISRAEEIEGFGGTQTQQWVTVVRTVDSGSTTPVRPPEPSNAEGTEPSPSADRDPGQSASRESKRQQTSSVTTATAWMAGLPVSNHPFFRSPRVNLSDLETRVNRDLFSLVSEGNRLWFPLLSEVRAKFRKQVLSKWELNYMARLAERLMANLFYYEHIRLPALPSRIAVVLGRRFLILDALVSILGLLGEPTDGEWWSALVRKIPHQPQSMSTRKSGSEQEAFYLELVKDLIKAVAALKTGVRLSSADTVNIKQRLLCSHFSPGYFKMRCFDPWRIDNKLFWTRLQASKLK